MGFGVNDGLFADFAIYFVPAIRFMLTQIRI